MSNPDKIVESLYLALHMEISDKHKLKPSEIIELLVTNGRFYTKDGFYFDRGKLVTLDYIEEKCIKAGLFNSTDINKVTDSLLKFKTKEDINFYDLYGSHLKVETEKPPIYDMLFNKELDYVCRSMAKSKIPYFVILAGINKAGKSIIMRILKHIFKDFTNAVTVESISTSFGLAPYARSLLCMGDDLGIEKLNSNVGSFKSIISGDTVSINEKHKSQYSIKVVANTVLGCNLLPYITVEDDGLMRRLLYFDFKDQLDVSLFNDDTAELERQIEQAANYIFTNRIDYQRSDLEAINLESQKAFFETTTMVKSYLSCVANHNLDTAYASYSLHCMRDNSRCCTKQKFEMIINAYIKIAKK